MRVAEDHRQRNRERIVFAAAVDHILPHEHTKPVAVIVPAQRFDLDVLAQRIEPSDFIHSMSCTIASSLGGVKSPSGQ